MKFITLAAIKNHGNQMAACGYFPGVLMTLWAEVAVEQAQDSEAMRIFWAMRARLGQEGKNEI